MLSKFLKMCFNQIIQIILRMETQSEPELNSKFYQVHNIVILTKPKTKITESNQTQIHK